MVSPTMLFDSFFVPLLFAHVSLCYLLMYPLFLAFRYCYDEGHYPDTSTIIVEICLFEYFQ
jgi:hypothetical protein